MVCLCLVGYVGTMIFPFAIMSDIIDTAELETGKSLSGSYTGAFNMMSSFGSATSMLIISIFLELLGSENRISYAIIFLFGSFLFIFSIIILKKVIVVGTKQRKRL